MSKGLKWQVVEDNGGGLHLAVLEDGRCIYYASGHEHHPAALRADVHALRKGEHPVRDGWEMPEDVDDPQAAYDDITRHEYGWQVVADQDGVYVDRMGAAARRALTARVTILALGAEGEPAERESEIDIPLLGDDEELLERAIREVAALGYTVVRDGAGGHCAVTRYSDGTVAVGVTVDRNPDTPDLVEEARKNHGE